MLGKLEEREDLWNIFDCIFHYYSCVGDLNIKVAKHIFCPSLGISKTRFIHRRLILFLSLSIIGIIYLQGIYFLVKFNGQPGKKPNLRTDRHKGQDRIAKTHIFHDGGGGEGIF